LPSVPHYLDWDRRHNLTGYLNLSIPPNDGPAILNFKPFAGINATLGWIYLSGLPYSPPTHSKEAKINTERLPSTSWLDLKVQKSFNLYGLKYTLFCEIHNLLDKKNILGFEDTDWYHNYKEVQQSFDKGEMDYENYIMLMDVQDPDDFDNDGIYEEPDGEVDFNKANPEMGRGLDPSVYGPRRRIYFGVQVSW